MSKLRDEIILMLRDVGGTSMPPSSYAGNNDEGLGVRVPAARKIAKQFTENHSELSRDGWIELLNELSRGRYDDEKQMIGKLLEYNSELRSSIGPEELDYWLDELVGWCQVDCLCQSSFTSDDLLSNWDVWKKGLRELSRSRNISERRASIVILNKPVMQSDDKRLADLGFELVDDLRDEKDKLITKAVSWILRSLIKHHGDRVRVYLDRNEDLLPRIAVREARKKLETGRKT